jgi:hypothetical protein
VGVCNDARCGGGVARYDAGGMLQRPPLWPSTNHSRAVRPSFCRHPIGQCLRATYIVVRPSFYVAKGKTVGEELGEAWQR